MSTFVAQCSVANRPVRERRPGAVRAWLEPWCLIERPIAARAQLPQSWSRPDMNLRERRSGAMRAWLGPWCLIERSIAARAQLPRSWSRPVMNLWERRPGAMRPLLGDFRLMSPRIHRATR